MNHQRRPQGMPSRPRLWNGAGFMPFRLEVLTPVFVGSGEELSPLEYVIRQEERGHALYLVDGSGWLRAHHDDAAVRSALLAGDMLGLRRLLSERLDVALYAQARLPIRLPALGGKLREIIHDPRSNSKAEILPFVRNAVTGCAVLPGSSLKGALTTPLLDHLDGLRAKLGLPGLAANYADTRKDMFGDISEHAMQALKVADIDIAPQGTGLVAAQEVRRSPGKTATPKPPCEALLPSSTPLYGSLHMDCRSGQPAVELPCGARFSRRQLGELCNAFYLARFRREWETFYAQPHLERTRQALRAVRERVETLDPERQWLVRVGRYSHVECVTVSRNAPSSRKGHGKTRTLADGLLPFGWIILHFCSETEYAEGCDAVRSAIGSARQTREERRAAREARLREAARQREEARDQQRRREEEAAAQAARLADLPPEERAIAALSQAGADDAAALSLFQMLDAMPEPTRRRAAAALKTFWESSDKWQGKQLSKKQKEKVRRIRDILGA